MMGYPRVLRVTLKKDCENSLHLGKEYSRHITVAFAKTRTNSEECKYSSPLVQIMRCMVVTSSVPLD